MLAYERAFEEHWTDVFRFALAWTNDWTAAEDLAQEAYLRLWNHRARLDWSRPVLPWLLVTTRRLATDRFRMLRRRLAAASSRRRTFGRRPFRRAGSTSVPRWRDLSPLERTALVIDRRPLRVLRGSGGVLGTTAGALRAAVSRARAKLETA